jgi:NifB/MoaA-like Fe-S oxidoreductase
MERWKDQQSLLKITQRTTLTMNEYLVSVKGYHNGTYRLTVKQSPSNKDCKYVSGDPFGCSRDYLVKSDEDAIHRLMIEHSTQVVCIKKG